MRSLRTDNRKALWISSLLVTLLLTACAGVEPFEPRDLREEGPERGMLSGADGEFVFYINLDEKESVSVESKEETDNQRE
jgi:hypothetical protein